VRIDNAGGDGAAERIHDRRVKQDADGGGRARDVEV
jgi:hypothetical protein